jgi:branched-chain amino acid transport system substrate-binding protein
MNKSKKGKIINLIVLFVFCSILIIGMNSATQAAEVKKETIKIGSLWPLTGPFAEFGQSSFKSSDLARIERNKAGGLLGKQIEFVVGDAVDARQAVSEAERLITQENVKVIIGTYSSGLSKVASDVAERNKVIYWEQVAVADDLTDRNYKYYFRTSPKASTYGVTSADFIRDYLLGKMGKKSDDVNVGIIHEDTLFGTTVAKKAKAECEKNGFKVVMVEPYSYKTTDLSSVILRLKNLNPDVIIGSQYLSDGILFQNQAAELGLKWKAFIGIAVGINEYFEAIGDKAKGNFVVQFATDQSSEKFAPGVKHIFELWMQEYKVPPKHNYPQSDYYATKVLFDAIEKAGSMDTDAIRKAIAEIDIPINKTPVGWGFKFDERGQNIRSVNVLIQWQEGKMKAVWPEIARLPGVEPIYSPRQ